MGVVLDFEDAVSQVKGMSGSYTGDLVTCVIGQKHSYCSTLVEHGNYSCRSAKQGFQGQQRLKAGSTSVSGFEVYFVSHSCGLFHSLLRIGVWGHVFRQWEGMLWWRSGNHYESICHSADLPMSPDLLTTPDGFLHPLWNLWNKSTLPHKIAN